MSTETIEGTSVEVEAEPVRAVVVAQPGQIVTSDAGPEGPAQMLAQATVIANALADVVERKRLYATISGRKFPQVEAWMTIGRMDNVVAREASRPTLNDDGSWEAEVELVRLSDGMVIGNASAMCGAPGDKPWDTRPSHQRRSMAVTRATSRAFRQQYSWIMVLAGYEPTPADEMPSDEEPKPERREEELTLLGEATRSGMIAKGDGRHSDLQAHETPDGHHIGFRLNIGTGKAIPQVCAEGAIGRALFLIAGEAGPASLKGLKVRVTGMLYEVHPVPPQRTTHRLILTRIESDEWVIPTETAAGGVGTPVEPEVSEPEVSEQSGSEAVAPGQEALPLNEDEKAAIAGSLG